MFKQIGNCCALNCYVENLDNEAKDSSFKKIVKKRLESITKLCENEETKNLAENALKKCEQCNYKNPSVFAYLDKNGIKF